MNWLQLLSRNTPISSAAANRPVTSLRSTNGIWAVGCSSSRPMGAFSMPILKWACLKCDRRMYVRRNGSLSWTRIGSSSREKSTFFVMLPLNPTSALRRKNVLSTARSESAK